MPIQRIGGPRPELYPQILDDLIAELEADVHQEDYHGDRPFIIEEADIRGTHLHVTVVWDKWDEVPREERGRIILDSYKSAKNRGEDVMRSIRIALGLTKTEAQTLGVLNG